MKKINFIEDNNSHPYQVKLINLISKIDLSRIEQYKAFEEYVPLCNFTTVRTYPLCGTPYIFSRHAEFVPGWITGAEAIKLNNLKGDESICFTKDQYDMLVLMAEWKYSGCKGYIEWYDDNLMTSGVNVNNY
jgi:hypothetical protein